MLGRAGQVDHLPVGQFQVIGGGRVVEDRCPGSASVPAGQRRPHLLRQGADQAAQGAVGRRELVKIHNAVVDLGGVGAAQLPAANPQEPGYPAGQELVGALGCRQGEGAELESRASLIGWGKLQIGTAQEGGEPAVGAAQIEDQDARFVLKGGDQQEVEGEAFAGAGRAENEGVAHIAGEKVVVVRSLAPGFQHGQGRPVQVLARGPSPGGPEDGSQAGQ